MKNMKNNDECIHVVAQLINEHAAVGCLAVLVVCGPWYLLPVMVIRYQVWNHYFLLINQLILH